MVGAFDVLARLDACAYVRLRSMGRMRPYDVHSGLAVSVGPAVVHVGLYGWRLGILLDGCCALSRNVAFVLGGCACMGLHPGWGSLSFVVRLLGRDRIGTGGLVPIAFGVWTHFRSIGATVALVGRLVGWWVAAAFHG